MISIRKVSVLVDSIYREAGREDGPPLKRVLVTVAIHNDPLIEAWWVLGVMMSRRLLVEFHKDPLSVESYGRGAIVGSSGEIERGYALITRPFAKAVRDALGAEAWMSDTVKRGPQGTRLDVPLAFKNTLYVRSHYDTIEAVMPNAPLPDEVMVVLAGANRGRLDACIGGLRREDVVGVDVYVDRE